MTPIDFINRWKDSGGAELANSQSFLKELCTLLDVPHPEPTQTDESQNCYVFEKSVEFNNGDGTTSAGRIDLYRQSCFVLESKQGVERKAAELAETLATKTKQKKFRSGTAKRGTPGWEQAMTKARQQAKGCAEALPDEWPPFLIVVDVGYCFDLYADFTQSGKNYVPFPDPQSYRLRLSDLADEQVRQRLTDIWTDPLSLDPSRRSARVTRDVAQRLAKLAQSLEGPHPADVVAQFLMRCLFTMFAEDMQIGGLKKGDFTKFLEARRDKLETFVPMMSQLWQEMDTGGFSVVLEGQLKQFNGGLFEDHTALPVTEDQLELLIESAQAQWNDVEPAIFGTLLERALDPVERHKLGAHYTPRAYVERLVMPTIIEPLRDQWDTVYATAVSQYEDGQAADAVNTVRRFHDQLCETRVLDPACGSGNFLYVSLELMKRLEGEVLKALRDFGDHQQVLLTIDPHQFLGIEVNPRAAAITDLVLWIGYLQWHFRTRGDDELHEPIIRNFHNIECRDAVLAWDDIEPMIDESGNPVTRWDGRTTKPHPVTGEEVPDETAQIQELRYINPRKAEWPKADYIVGNPPFVGNKRMRFHLGDGYVDTLRKTYSTTVPKSADYVMFWWSKASKLVSAQKCERFGLIATNSITQVYNRKLVENFLDVAPDTSIILAIPDHPWVDTTDGAAVRISMTVGAAEKVNGRLNVVTAEDQSDEIGYSVTLNETVGKISSNLTIGADTSSTVRSSSNQDISTQGVTPLGKGFRLSRDQLPALNIDPEDRPPVVKCYMIGRDLVQRAEEKFIIDFFGLDLDAARNQYPALLQIVTTTVKPERDAKVGRSKDADQYAKQWWLFAKTRSTFRPALNGIERYIATCRTAKHRIFSFIPVDVLPDAKIVAIALNDAFHLGVLSSSIHVNWAMRTGAWLGVGNDSNYNHSDCFGKFSFPAPDTATEERIRSLGEQLDAHRKRQQELHPDLTMTGMYNVLEKLRAAEHPKREGEAPAEPERGTGVDSKSGSAGASPSRDFSLTKKERDIHEKGLVSVLKQIHDELDAAVADAYGWPHDLDDEEILQRLVDLNHERAAEEAQGHIRWLRPDFQNPDGQPKETQKKLDIGDQKPRITDRPVPKIKKQPWPKSLPERMTSVRSALTGHGGPATVAEIAKNFTRARKDTVEELLETLVTVGQARQTSDGRYVA